MKRRQTPLIERLEGRELLSGLAYSLTTDQPTYLPGQPVTMTFQETNTSDQAVTVSDGPSLDGFDVSRGNKRVWQSNAGINPMFIRAVDLQPGQSLTLTATWDGIPDGSSAASTGTFAITNQLAPTAASATITIADAPARPTPSPTTTTATPTPRSLAPAGSVSSIPVAASPIAVSVATDHASYRQGDPIRMTVQLSQHGTEPVRLSRRSAVQLLIQDGQGQVTRLSRHIPRAAVRRLSTGHSLAIQAVWKARRLHLNAPTPDATYTVQAIAAGDSASTSFQVVG